MERKKKMMMMMRMLMMVGGDFWDFCRSIEVDVCSSIYLEWLDQSE
jgi:hypothetical protein